MIDLSKILKNSVIQSSDLERIDEVFEKLYKVHPEGRDPWGLDLKRARKTLEYFWPLYKNYFKVRVFGKENVTNDQYMVISNHSGQIAIDGMLISTAFVMEMQEPRVLRSMVERFFTALPFIGTWGAEGGAVLGDRQNCLNLMEKGQSILVFPEGVRGVAKSSSDFYKLQNFTKGFFRICLRNKVSVLPIAVVGAEEFFPYVYQAKGIAKALGLPALPISANYFPLPSPVDIYIGKPYEIPEGLTADSPDKEIDEHVYKIEEIIKEMTQEGLKKRREFWANKELDND